MIVHPIHYSVTIVRSPTYGLGLGISGIRSSKNAKTKFIVSDVIKNGPAYEKVSKNDELISVNGINLDCLRYSEAIQILRECGDEAELKLISRKEQANYHNLQLAPEKDFIMQQTNFSSLREPQINCDCMQNYRNHCIDSMKYRSDTALWDPNYTYNENRSENYPRLVEIHLKRRNAAESLGVELLSRLTVASVDENSLGEQAGLKSGDRIIRINGINTAHLSLIDTANMLRRQETILLVARNTLMKENEVCDNFGTTPLVNSSSVPANLSSLLTHQLGDEKRQYQASQPRIQSNKSSNEQIRTMHFEQAYQSGYHTYENCGGCQSMCEVHDNNFENPFVKNSNNWIQSQTNTSNICENSIQHNHIQHNVSNIRNNEFLESNQNPKTHKKSNIQARESNDQYCSNFLKEDKEQLLNTFNSPKNRKVTLQTNQGKCDIGLILYGGNTKGVYVSKVIPDSIADQAGVSEGDKLVKLNGTDLKGWTKEEVFLALMASENKMILELLHDPLSYHKMLKSEIPHESFYVRAYFNMNQYVSGSSALMSSVKYSGLFIVRGDIFHVHDTLLDNALGTWLATKAYPNTSSIGLIPNEQRAQRFMSANQFQENAQESFSPPPYERVVQLDKFPFPRPVVIFGPLCELARQRLTQMSSIIPNKLDYSIEEPIKFIIPPISSSFTSNNITNSNNGYSINEENCNNNKPLGLIRLSAITECMKRGYHCLLDIGPTAIERLTLLGIPPIVILINPSSEYQLKVLLKHYWQFNKTSSALFIPSRVSSRTRPTIKEMVTTLWNSVIHLRQYKSHVITDTVPLLNITSKENSFSEIEWLRNLSEVIRHQQNSPVWIGEETEFGQLKINGLIEEEQEGSDDVVTKSDSETPRPANCDKNICSEDEETRHSSRNTKETRPEMNGMVRNEVSSTIPENNKYIPPFRQVPVCHANEVMENTNKDTSYKSKTKDYCNCTCNFDNANPTNQEETKFKEIIEQTDILSMNNSPFSLGTLRLHIESMSIKHPRFDHSFDETKPGFSNIHPINELERNDGQTPTISPTLSLHQLVFDDITSSDFHTNDEQKHLSADLISNVADPQSGISSLPTSPRTILAEKCGEFGSRGGILEIPEHKVCLRIPEGAISEEEGLQKIFIRVYESGNELTVDNLPHENHLSSDKPILVSPMVMCGPRGLTFHKPVELTVPRYPLESESSDESETKLDKHLEKWNLSLLHASAISTSTSTDDDSLPRTSRSNEPTKWHEIPLSAKCQSSVKNETNSQKQKHNTNQGILSVIKDSHISILIDHF
ncbi:putative tight junction protein [Schistosoma mansoni]|uniref:Putative tight junction protein n=1 Tax=Schistosoma mansoni TaxID=6183 RepID=G4VGU1_SCHMA|nr:putative tight junction protein [Schistosoma mansoni]|eukprot:XP_018650827.1 putative tight junction protein [Schistosoma mansoni]